MDSLKALHSAARQYCIERAATWHQRYAQLSSHGRAHASRSDGGWDYTAAAYHVFPRYQVLAAIQSEIESFLPTDFQDLEELRRILELVAATARSMFTDYSDPIAVAAVADERQRFAVYICALDDARLAAQCELPFRRTLGSEEHQQLRAAIAQRWGNWYGGDRDGEAPEHDVVTLHLAAMKEPESYEALRRFLMQRGIGRLFEIREHGDGFELETDAASFAYNGAEGFWTSGDLGWLVYASHESSITFGSKWLVEKMRTVIPECEKYIYKGWDLSTYP